MPELTANQKIAIQEYIKSLEDRKDQRLSGQVNRWLGVIGLSSATVVGGVWLMLQYWVTYVAERKTSEIATAAVGTGQLEAARSAAYKAIYSSEANAAVNLERSRSLLTEINGSLAVAQQLKDQFRSAKEISDAAALLNDAKQGIVTLIKSDKDLQDLLLGNVGIPGGAVVAYSGQGSAESCPRGWKRFGAASGRVIVGAGENTNKDAIGVNLSQYNIGTVGGSENQLLTVEQLPPQTVSVSGFAVQSRVDRYEAGGKDYPVVTVSTGTINIGGGGAPVPNMPPFVALYYCIKD